MATTPERQFKLYVLNASHLCACSVLLPSQMLTPSTQHEKLVLDIDIAQRSIVVRFFLGSALVSLIATAGIRRAHYRAVGCYSLASGIQRAAISCVLCPHRLALIGSLGVTKVVVSNVPARFTQYNYLEQVVAEEEAIRDLEAWSKAYKAALEASDVGELWIDIPRDVPITKKAAPKPANPLSLAVSSMDPENGPSVSAAASATTGFEPLVVKVHYELRDPQGGVYFLLPDVEANPGRAPRTSFHPLTTGTELIPICRYVCQQSSERRSCLVSVLGDAHRPLHLHDGVDLRRQLSGDCKRRTIRAGAR